jgi:hypothetical protein
MSAVLQHFATPSLDDSHSILLFVVVVTVWRRRVHGNAAANGPVAHLPDDTRLDMKQRWNDFNRRNSVKPAPVSLCPSQTSHEPPRARIPALRDEKLANKPRALCYGRTLLVSTPIGC